MSAKENRNTCECIVDEISLVTMKLFKTLGYLPIFVVSALLLVSYAEGQTVHKGLYTSEINNAHVTIPKKVSSRGEHMSHDLTSFHEHGNVHYNVTIAEKDYLLALEPAIHFVGPAIIVERRKRDLHTRTKPKLRSTGCHFQGTIYGQPSSRVALSTCNGLIGLIHTEDGKYYIEPSHHKDGLTKPGHKHLIYKRSAVQSPHNKRKRKKKKKKHSYNCGTREPKRLTEMEWQKQIGKVKVLERHKHKDAKLAKQHQQNNHHHHHHQFGLEPTPFKKHKHSKNMILKKKKIKKRSVSKPRYVEALLVADSTMVDFHEDDDIEVYLLTIMNMVSSLYGDPSIGNLIRVVVVKIILIDDPAAEPDLNVTINADQTLKSFCRWQKNLKTDDSDPTHHDVAILMTRKDICAKQNVPCNTLGVAHVGGMCKSDKSCSVNEDNGITLAHTITHEMGHNFGMYHDTDKIGCRGREGSRLHIMTPMFESDTVEVSWSRCSRRDVTNFLDRGMGECLKDEPGKAEDYKYPNLPPGAMYNAEKQCYLQFGADSKVCAGTTDICSQLWCNVSGVCSSRLRAAASGTQCGKHMWCQEQKCVPIMEPPRRIDGGWGEWSDWSECSRTCGAGVSAMQRECDHPKPSSGGRFCVGERRRYRICNTDPCPDDQPTFRAVQCSAYDNHTHEGKKYTWLPYFDQDEPCELYCSDVNDTIIVPWGDHALDGTPCNVGSRDVCISGICKKVGCDWIVDSDAEEDICGICQGDGTKCDTIRGEYTKQSDSQGYREMIVIPPDSRNIRIEEEDRSENYISVGSATSRKFYLNGKRHITLPGEYRVAGAQALYERDNEMEKLRIPGPIKEAIVVYVIFRGKVRNPGISYQYTMAKKLVPKEVKYVWNYTEWTQCSVTCGGGIQQKHAICMETITSTLSAALDGTPHIVDEAMCNPDDKPDPMMRVCKEEKCFYNWWVGPWQSCPVTCTKKGERHFRHRSVMCVDSREMALPDSDCKFSRKPSDYELCEKLPLCIGET